jgi:hypothetical protein
LFPKSKNRSKLMSHRKNRRPSWNFFFTREEIPVPNAIPKLSLGIGYRCNRAISILGPLPARPLPFRPPAKQFLVCYRDTHHHFTDMLYRDAKLAVDSRFPPASSSSAECWGIGSVFSYGWSRHSRSTRSSLHFQGHQSERMASAGSL